MEQLIKLLKEKTGVDDATADKIGAFIQEHLQDFPKLLGGDLAQKAEGLLQNSPAAGLLDAAKDALGQNQDKP